MTEPAETATPPASKPETFSREYVSELREESKSNRLARQDAETRAAAAEALALSAKTEAEAFKTDLQTKADQRIIRAELKAEALKAGMVDIDGLKLADLSTIKLDDNGEVIGAEDLMKALKESKPYLFKPASTSSTETPPPANDPTKKLAKDMTPAEYAAARRNIR